MSKKFILFCTVIMLITSMVIPAFAQESLRTVDDRGNTVINSKRITEIQTEIKNIELEALRLKEKNDKLTQSMQSMMKEIEKANSDMNKYLSEMITSKAKLETASIEDKDKLNAQVTDLNALIKQAKAYVQYLMGKIKESKETIKNNEAKIAELNNKIEKLNKDLAKEKNKKAYKPVKKPTTSKEEKEDKKAEVKEEFVTVKFVDVGTGDEEVKVIGKHKIKKGETIEPPTIETPKGYKFSGWFLNGGYAEEFDSSMPINKDTDIYTKWDKIEEPAEEPTKNAEEPIENTEEPAEEEKPTEEKPSELQEGDPDDVDELKKLIDDVKSKQTSTNALLQDMSFEAEGIKTDLQKLENDEDKCNLVKAVINSTSDTNSELDGARADITELNTKIESIERSLQYLKDGKLISEEEEVDISASVVEVKNSQEEIDKMSDSIQESLDEVKAATDEIKEECKANEEPENTKKVKIGEEENKNKPKKTIGIIIGAVVIIAIIGVAGFFVYKNNKQ